MIQEIILSNLMSNEKYARRVLPYIKSDYFADIKERTVFELIETFVEKYNGMPTRESLAIELSSMSMLSEQGFSETVDLIESLRPQPQDEQWLLDRTEQFCQDRALALALDQAINVIGVDDKTSISKGAIPQMLADALAVSFNNNIGHDYFGDFEARFEFYNKKEDRIKFGLSIFDKITGGGLPKKTLNIILAGTGVGKSLFMCDIAANHLMDGKNVLYITMEMAEERIAERIDAKLLDVSIKDLNRMPYELYQRRMERVRSKTVGKLVIKEYPTASANVNHFRALLNELKLKKNFVPDVIFIDYLNICASARIKANANANSYTYVKAIAEEIRGLAVEYNVPIITATQTNRSGYTDMDVDLTSTSESFGLPMTADFMFALMTNEELEKLGQIMVKQLKNRYGPESYYKRFVIGVERSKMTLFDIEDDHQPDAPSHDPETGEIEEDNPVFDNSRFNDDTHSVKDRKSKFKRIS